MSLVNHPAPEFNLVDTAGNTHRVKDELGNWQLLVFHRHLG